MKKIIQLCSLVLILIGAISCSSDSYNGLDNRGGVQIIDCKDDTAKQINIDSQKYMVRLVYPSTTDLSHIQPAFTLSEGAQFADESMTGVLNLSTPITARVIQGNLYADYQLVATHVDAQIQSLAIGKYKGVIDHSARTVTIKMPLDTDVTALKPVISITEGATLLSPTEETLDFSQPVSYQLAYLDEEFEYTVSVELAEITPIAFIGEASSANGLNEPDDLAAWEWASSEFAEATYISFEEIKKGADLNAYAAIWYHHDPDALELPSIATDAKVIESLQTYHQKGGGLLLTAAGILLAKDLDVTLDGQVQNNEWGWGNKPTAIDEAWGIKIKGYEAHPIYKGLRKEAGQDDIIYLVSKGCYAKGHNAIWNFEDWTGYNWDVAAWTAKNGGQQLASRPQDANMDVNSTITLYEYTDARGRVITIAHESFDWYNEEGSPINSYRDNLETLTYNIINFISK